MTELMIYCIPIATQRVFLSFHYSLYYLYKCYANYHICCLDLSGYGYFVYAVLHNKIVTNPSGVYHGN